MVEREGRPPWFLAWLDAERQARQLRVFQSVLIPALLQTEGYARAVIRCDDLLSDDEGAQRVGRQAILDRPDPPQLIAVVDEANLATLLARWETVHNEALSRQQSIELLNEW
ncbi:Scr1 family TA system antitoxin-like transcriptional regulator [Micromonospora andamanensis]|uniref:DUF5753 domain-containing protein n=1 Tax=Micromonospora andamanensis TaxID=1287068 RepID=A0ABQ4HZS9_9ACTN|nr:Scr1 family TA system antitoxin-like transcriptional regulator [Micromonospora andamanensis]GIJ11111.1 hypothetical protein Van01_43250 [Micromonospora andamanensis]